MNGVKWIFVKLPWTFTNNIPDWAWMAWAWAFAICACLLLRVDVLSKLFDAADFNLEVPWSYIASGFAIGVSSNVLYSVVKPISKKLKKDGKIVCLPPGTPLPTTETVTETTPEATTTTTTTESSPVKPVDIQVDFPQVSYGKTEQTSTPYVPKHAAPEQDRLFSLTLVEPTEPVWIGKESDPTHVLVPKGWPSE